MPSNSKAEVLGLVENSQTECGTNCERCYLITQRLPWYCVLRCICTVFKEQELDSSKCCISVVAHLPLPWYQCMEDRKLDEKESQVKAPWEDEAYEARKFRKYDIIYNFCYTCGASPKSLSRQLLGFP